jgi:hypothetical protein
MRFHERTVPSRGTPMRIHAGLRPLKPSAKIKRQGGRRNGNERVNPKLLPGKATVDVPQVPQRGCGDDRSNQESQRILESGVDNVFHFFELSSKDLEPSHKLFLGFSRPVELERCHSPRMQSRDSDSATFSVMRGNTTSSLCARLAKRPALVRAGHMRNQPLPVWTT